MCIRDRNRGDNVMNCLVIEKEKLVHNINVLKKQIGTKIIGVVKGDGYGLGLLDFAKVLRENGITMFAVCELWEARLLRENGFTEDILLMRSTSVDSEVEEILNLSLIATVGSYEAAVLLNGLAQKQGKKARAHICLLYTSRCV